MNTQHFSTHRSVKILLALCCLFASSLVSSLSLSAISVWNDIDNPAAREIQDLVGEGLKNLIVFNNLSESHTASCSLSDIVVRKGWHALSAHERKDYTDAILCLQSKNARLDLPGTKSRFDDFVAVHINLTRIIHYSGTFLSWHRYYIWSYEQSLRDECGYKGFMPYWDWGLYVAAPQNSSIFSGSPYSMGSNGVYIPHGNGSSDWHSYGTGGGCVFSGPFTNMIVNLGPVGLHNTTGLPPVYPNAGLFDYNPRCLKRDVNPSQSQAWTTYERTLDLIVNYTDIEIFQARMQSDPRYFNTTVFTGVHSGGHNTISGDPGGDLYVSPGDPVFYLHHAQIDRVWAIWQNLDPPNRQNTIFGTGTFQNIPPSANVTMDDYVSVGVLNEPKKVRELLSTVAGPFCYVYV